MNSGYVGNIDAVPGMYGSDREVEMNAGRDGYVYIEGSKPEHRSHNSLARSNCQFLARPSSGVIRLGTTRVVCVSTDSDVTSNPVTT